jgi:hypothetical protein
MRRGKDCISVTSHVAGNLHSRNLGLQIREDEMGGVFSTHVRDRKFQ